MTYAHCNITRLLALVFAAMVFCTARPAAGQLTLDAFAPAHGATEVSTMLTVTLTFSVALDTTVGFDVTEGFFLGFEMLPDPGAPLDVRLSGDGRTVSLDYALEEDTRYQALLTAALSATGEPLARPVAFAFSTGSTLPTGSVSGTVSLESGDPTGAVVGLFAARGLFFDEEVGALAVVGSASGAFTIPFVPADTYLVAALKDLDGDQNFDPDTGDALRFYDAEGDRVIDEVVVAEGQAVAGIDLRLGLPESTTARTPFAAALQVSSAVHEGVDFIAAFGEASAEGTSGFWVYLFHDAVAQDTVEVVALGGQVSGVDGFLESGDDEGPPFDVLRPLPENWIDSDAAASAAEANGGADYRVLYPNATQLMLLTTLDEGACSRFGKTQPVAASAALQKVYWVNIYFPSEPQVQPLVVCVDALTGRVAVEAAPGVPATFVLAPNYPNPFNPETTIAFGLAAPGPAQLVIYDVQGRHVATVVEAVLPAGNYVVPWRAEGLASGVYFYRLVTPTTTHSRAMILAK